MIFFLRAHHSPNTNYYLRTLRTRSHGPDFSWNIDYFWRSLDCKAQIHGYRRWGSWRQGYSRQDSLSSGNRFLRESKMSLCSYFVTAHNCARSNKVDDSKDLLQTTHPVAFHSLLMSLLSNRQMSSYLRDELILFSLCDTLLINSLCVLKQFVLNLSCSG